MPLRQLHPDPGQQLGDAFFRVDIIAVHGLNPRSRDDTEHAWNTWRNRGSGRLWLRDDLPQWTPDARIFLYEYNATAVYGKDKSTFVDKSNEMLEAIRAERYDENKPILFLAHSMGGLLVKQALINACINPKYRLIKDMTKGIAFFATPHHGGDGTLVGLGSVAAKIARAAGFQQGDDVLETLKNDSMFSDIMHEHWRHQMSEYKITSFWGALDTVVPGESAKLGMSGDREHVVKLNTDHKGVCKFGRSQGDEDNLKIVGRNVQDMYNAVLEESMINPARCQMYTFPSAIPPASMNSLNLSMSIKGLRIAAEHLCSLLHSFSASWGSVTILKDSRQEITLVRIGLHSIERYLQRLDTVDTQRKKLIQIDDLIITFSESMMAFSEFEDLLRQFETMRQAGVVIKWANYLRGIQQYLGRIQRLKESLNLMLTIVECDTSIEAYETRDRLHILLETVIDENQALKTKLSQLEDRFDAKSTITLDPRDDDEGSETTTIRDPNRAGSVRHSTRPLETSDRISFTFENILQQSWVYKRNEKNESDQSFVTTTTDARSRTWSVFSGISMAHISILSMIAIPITLIDISYAHYYEFRPKSISLAPATADEGDRSNDSLSDVSTEEDAQFTRIFFSLERFTDIAIRTFPNFHVQLRGGLKNAMQKGDAPPLIQSWTELIALCDDFMNQMEVMKTRLSRNTLYDPGIRSQSSFWGLCGCIIRSWSDLAWEVKQAMTRVILPHDTRVRLRPIHQRISETLEIIMNSPWRHLLEESIANDPDHSGHTNSQDSIQADESGVDERQMLTQQSYEEFVETFSRSVYSGWDDQEDVFPCKRCGEILEEVKAIELAGNRWHFDCFRCNTCSTLLDCDSNLFLLGDGSLVCSYCTYTCSACGDKIEELAILTGDQAFCYACFSCRNCKRKIEDFRYTRTSQGIFCIDCHEEIMAEKRKLDRARISDWIRSTTPQHTVDS